jgi:hypothetical protein
MTTGVLRRPTPQTHFIMTDVAESVFFYYWYSFFLNSIGVFLLLVLFLFELAVTMSEHDDDVLLRSVTDNRSPGLTEFKKEEYL